MRFDPGKAWPHPVLRPPSIGDDYPSAEFQVELDVQRIKGSTALEIVAEYALSEPDLLTLIKADKARYSLLIRSPKTHYRALYHSAGAMIKCSIPAGELAGRVEFSPFLICTRTLDQFRSSGWHEDFRGRSFKLSPGSVLAEEEPRIYWVDTADEAPLSAIFEHRERSDLPDGRWQCQLDDDRVGIEMSSADSKRFESARNRVNRTPEGQYLMNGIFLPALIHVLSTADQDSETFANRRWFAALDQRLEAIGCEPLGANGPDRLVDAQRILESPFGKMPIISLASDDY